MKDSYFDTVMQIERLHHLFFDVLKAELDRLSIKDISNMQCFILYNIGNNQMTVGEISNRGYYLGSNVTYNLKKMVENEYLVQEQSPHDKRSSHVRLSDKGKGLLEKLDKVIDGHAQNLKHNNLAITDLKAAQKTLSNLETFWRFHTSHNITHSL